MLSYYLIWVFKTISRSNYKNSFLHILLKWFVFISKQTTRSFRWKFNNSGETLDVGKERHHRNGSTSVLQYTPVTDQVSNIQQSIWRRKKFLQFFHHISNVTYKNACHFCTAMFRVLKCTCQHSFDAIQKRNYVNFT